MSLSEKNELPRPLSLKKDFDLLKSQARSFSCQWLKAFFASDEKSNSLKAAWSLPKRHVADSVTRNRLKRWGRERLRGSSLKGLILLSFLKRERGFYQQIRRKDFDSVFDRLLEKIKKES